jgi:hypothetical protein
MASERKSLKAVGINVALCLVTMGIALASYLTVSSWWARPYQQVAGSGGESDSPADPTFNPFAEAHGTNLVVYFLTSSTCGWSKLLSESQRVRSLRTRVQSAHAASYAKITLVAVGVDDELDAGLKSLQDLSSQNLESAFDQIMVGGGWLNEQVVRVVWRERMMRPAIPQILAIERPVSTDAYLSKQTIGVGEDKVVANLVGNDEIWRWLKDGLPLQTKTVTPVAPDVGAITMSGKE